MEIVLLAALALVPLAVPADPAPGVFRSRAEARRFDCERLDVETARRRYPGRVQEEAPRGDYADRSVVVCAEQLLRPGLRPPRDEAILTGLDAETLGLASAVEALHPELRGRTWLVEAVYPNAAVSSKIAFAAKNALMGRGLTVSDRRPTLGATDIGVISAMTPDDAYRAACVRFAATGTLRAGDVLLAVGIRDLRETVLHAGVCDGGRWSWLQ